MSESNKSVFWSRACAIALAIVAVVGIVSYAIPNEVDVEVPVNQTVIEYVQNTTEVPVDNGNLGLVLDHLYDNDGNVNYLLDDLDDDEVEQIADRIVFVNEIKTLAADFVDKEMADELDKTVLGDVTFDEDDIEKIKVKDDPEDIVITDIDFEDGEADLEVTVDFEQDDIDYTAVFKVEIEDGEVDDISLVSVDLD